MAVEKFYAGVVLHSDRFVAALILLSPHSGVPTLNPQSPNPQQKPKTRLGDLRDPVQSRFKMTPTLNG